MAYGALGNRCLAGVTQVTRKRAAYSKPLWLLPYDALFNINENTDLGGASVNEMLLRATCNRWGVCVGYQSNICYLNNNPDRIVP